MSTYSEARKQFFMLEQGQNIVIKMKPKELAKFRDSIYKLTKRYKAYDKFYKTRFLNTKQLQIWRIK